MPETRLGPVSSVAAEAAPPPAGLRDDVVWVLRAELTKLAARQLTRALVLLALAGPLLFTLATRLAHATPGDTPLGAWVHASGFDPPLVLLAFMASFGFPVTAALVGGDLFAGEDRHGTWTGLLTRAVDRRAIFLGKLAAALIVCALLLVLCAAAALLAGLAIVGAQPVIGFSGQSIAAAPAFGLTLAAWLLDLAPLFCFLAFAILASVATRHIAAGVLLPVVLALVLQFLARVGNGGWGHQLLPLAAFDAWHGLFTTPAQALPLVGVAVSLLWGGAALGVAGWLFSRREFAGGAPTGSRAGWSGATALLGGLLVAAALLVGLCFLGPDPVTPARLEANLRPTFNRLTIDQQALLGRTTPAGTRLDDRAVCARRGLARDGAGDDWTCTVEVLTPQADTPTPNFEPVDYDVSVKVNGCWSAAGPPSFIGDQSFRTRRGRTVTNPLFEIYGCLNPL